MGVFDLLRSGLGGLRSAAGSLLGGVEDLGRIAAREVGEFGGGVLGGLGAGIAGRQASIPTRIGGIADIPEVLGGAIGGAVGGGLRAGLQQRIATAVGGLRQSAHDLLTGGRPSHRVLQSVLNPEVGSAGVGVTAQTAQGVPGALEPLGLSLGGAMSQPGAGAVAQPGGASISRAGFGVTDVLGPLIGGGIQALMGGREVANGGELVAPGAAAGTIFRVQGQRLTPRRMFSIVNPFTGTTHWYRNVGRPILFSGDFATCKRVDKIARRAKSARRGR